MTATTTRSSDFILVIEDNWAIRTATVRLLKNAGYKVGSAPNGLDAMRYLYSHALPRLILLDLNMPVMDGWQFRVRQQQDPVLSRIPVVLVSSEDDLEETAEALHARSCLHKPIEANALLELVAQPVG